MNKRLTPKELYESNMRVIENLERENRNAIIAKGITVLIFMAVAFILGALIS